MLFIAVRNSDTKKDSDSCTTSSDCASSAKGTIYCCKSGDCSFTEDACKVKSCSSSSDCYFPGVTTAYCCSSGKCSYSNSVCSKCSSNDDCKTGSSSVYCCSSGQCYYDTANCARTTCSFGADCYYPGVPAFCCRKDTCLYTILDCSPPTPPNCTSSSDCVVSDSTDIFCCITGNCYYTPTSCSMPTSCTADSDCYIPGYNSACCRSNMCTYNSASCITTSCSSKSDCYYSGLSGPYCCRDGKCGYNTATCYDSYAKIVDDGIILTAKISLAISIVYFAASAAFLVCLLRKNCVSRRQSHDSAQYLHDPQGFFAPAAQHSDRPGLPSTAAVSALPMLVPVDPNVPVAPGQPLVMMEPVTHESQGAGQIQILYPPAPPVKVSAPGRGEVPTRQLMVGAKQRPGDGAESPE